MNRTALLSQLECSEPWDLVVVGGGAVGMGTAWDAAARGHRVVLLEQYDFCKGTSSRSTKLIHGGVRYLRQGNFSLVREALRERELLLRNAPQIVRPLRFVIPCFGHAERWYYRTGMRLYDALAGSLQDTASRSLSTQQVCAAVPGISHKRLQGGVAYFDAQFDDASLVIALAKAACAMGGVPLNYVRVVDVLKRSDRIVGVRAVDEETNQEYELQAKSVVNATGVFSDALRQLDDPGEGTAIAPSQGIHLVVDQRFLGGDDALMIPKTKDGRVLFAVPWLGRVLLGTTDTPVAQPAIEPRPLEAEISYLLHHFRDYLAHAPQREDVRSIFAGLRPLVSRSGASRSSASMSREHMVVTSKSGMVSILGGKWTTFRKMAKDVVDQAELVGHLTRRDCPTQDLVLNPPKCRSDDPLAQPSAKQVQIAVAEEFARGVEDVLARRFRSLLLDAQSSIEAAPTVAAFMATELGQTEAWVTRQVSAYTRLASQYLGM